MVHLLDLTDLPGGAGLSDDFCNTPCKVVQSWDDLATTAVLLCGRLTLHDGGCDPCPPLSDVVK